MAHGNNSIISRILITVFEEILMNRFYQVNRVHYTSFLILYFDNV
jgi:hypothetical protein